VSSSSGSRRGAVLGSSGGAVLGSSGGAPWYSLVPSDMSLPYMAGMGGVEGSIGVYYIVACSARGYTDPTHAAQDCAALNALAKIPQHERKRETYYRALRERLAPHDPNVEPSWLTGVEYAVRPLPIATTPVVR
jgi:hypothetical protein